MQITNFTSTYFAPVRLQSTLLKSCKIILLIFVVTLLPFFIPCSSLCLSFTFSVAASSIVIRLHPKVSYSFLPSYFPSYDYSFPSSLLLHLLAFPLSIALFSTFPSYLPLFSSSLFSLPLVSLSSLLSPPSLSLTLSLSLSHSLSLSLSLSLCLSTLSFSLRLLTSSLSYNRH